MASTAILQTTIPLQGRAHGFVRALFFVYVVLVACPIRYWQY